MKLRFRRELSDRYHSLTVPIEQPSCPVKVYYLISKPELFFKNYLHIYFRCHLYLNRYSHVQLKSCFVLYLAKVLVHKVESIQENFNLNPHN